MLQWLPSVACLYGPLIGVCANQSQRMPNMCHFLQIKMPEVEHDRICMALRHAVYELAIFVHPAEGVCAGNPSEASL